MSWGGHSHLTETKMTKKSKLKKNECYQKKRGIAEILNTELSFSIKMCWRCNVQKDEDEGKHYTYYIIIIDFKYKILFPKLIKNSRANFSRNSVIQDTPFCGQLLWDSFFFNK